MCCSRTSSGVRFGLGSTTDTTRSPLTSNTMGTWAAVPSARRVARYATRPVAKRRRASSGSRRIGLESVELQTGQHVLAVEAQELRLVATDVVDVDPVKAGVDEALEMACVVLGALADEDPVGEALRPDGLGHGGEVLGIADVLLGEGHPTVRPFSHGVALGFVAGGRPRDVDLEELGHDGRVFASLAGTLRVASPRHLDLL